MPVDARALGPGRIRARPVAIAHVTIAHQFRPVQAGGDNKIRKTPRNGGSS